MGRSNILSAGVVPGALGGLAGGLVFGGAMADLGLLPTVASIFRVQDPYVGFIVHMVIAAIVGAGLGIMVWRLEPGVPETLFWGMVYGILWWFLGSLTLHPLFLGNTIEWTVGTMGTAFPALLGHVLYGSTAGLAIILVRWSHHFGGESDRPTRGAMLRGALAGLVSAWMSGMVLSAQGHLNTFPGEAPIDSRLGIWLAVLLIGLVAGLAFSLMYPSQSDSAGAGIIRGAMYGFLLWIVVPLSISPVSNGLGLPWSVEQVHAAFPSMPGYILFGSALALLYQWLGVLVNSLFSDIIAGSDDEGVGTQGLRAVGRGVVSGLVGGAIFTGVMAQIGFFGAVASLIRATSPVTGFLVHMLIAVIVGTTYALLFRRQSYDVGSALGWGVSYGFIWWVLGPLTLMPVILGTTPVWTVDVAAQVYPNLIGHLGYGAGLGVTLYILEARHTPWWIPHAQANAARVARRKQQVMTSAPALWTMVIVISLTLPIILGTAP